jgi:D-lyxose ketol-isomerase
MTKSTILRSRVNEILRQSDDFIRSFGFVLPPFAYWSPAEMKTRRADIDNIIDAGLGWDITDFGFGKFDEFGLFLFTVRNGNASDLKKGSGMLYAEKAMISRENQGSPMHRHYIKSEDIINRGGATLVIELFGDTDGKCDRTRGTVVYTDGIRRELEPGHKLKLSPGQSVTLMPNEHWHAFWGEGGDVFIGEVSTVNDDVTDNAFEDPAIARFSGIEEDEEPLHLLVSDYEKWLRP